MQRLHFMNELDCYKDKGNKKQLLNIIQVLCSHNIVTLKDIRYSIKNPQFLKTGDPIKNQSYMLENYLQNKEFTWVSQFFI